MNVPCTRCVGGTWTRQDGTRWRCAFCGGTGRIEATPRQRRAGLSVEQQQAIVEAYQQRGATLRTVAAQAFVCPSTVANVLIALGIPRRHRGGSRPTLTTEVLLEVGELYAQGYTQREIAAAQGVSRSTIHWRLMRLEGRKRTRSESARLAWDRRKGRLSLWGPQ